MDTTREEEGIYSDKLIDTLFQSSF